MKERLFLCMIHLHATKKLLNVIRQDASMLVTKAGENQHLHNWYVTLTGSGFPGKMLVLYIHEPSLLTIVVKGKTVKNTYVEFTMQLRELLKRCMFHTDFTDHELNESKEYVIGKTNNTTMLGHMNQLLGVIKYMVDKCSTYEQIDTTLIENVILTYLYKSKGENNYRTPLQYWEKLLGFKCTCIF